MATREQIQNRINGIMKDIEEMERNNDGSLEWVDNIRGLHEQLFAAEEELANTIIPVPEEELAKRAMKTALINLRNAFCEVLGACEFTTEFNPETYPFDRCFYELTDEVITWVEKETESL
jgi:hypothetical protein